MWEKTKIANFLSKLGQRLRELSLEKGWTLEETENHGWPNWKHLQRIEMAKNETILTLRKASDLYGVSLSRMFDF